MATIQVRVDDTLRDQAQRVAQDMGLDVSSAVRLFLAQMVRENGLPFRPTADPFYSASNQAALVKSLAQLEEGALVTKTLAQLDDMGK